MINHGVSLAVVIDRVPYIFPFVCVAALPKAGEGKNFIIKYDVK